MQFEDILCKGQVKPLVHFVGRVPDDQVLVRNVDIVGFVRIALIDLI